MENLTGRKRSPGRLTQTVGFRETTRMSGGPQLKKLMACLAAVLAFGAAAAGADAQKAGDPKEGLVLAQQVCTRCHATVADEVRSPNAKAPRFADLASSPGMTGTALMVALTTPHADMPMFTFTSEQRDDIVAYILSLH